MSRAVIQDQLLGTLSPDEGGLSYYNGSLAVVGGSIGISLEAALDGSLAVALGRAHGVVADLASYLRRAEDHAVSGLLATLNGNWLEDDEEPITADEFRGAIAIDAIVFWRGGTVLFYYTDGGVFAGHSIEVRMDPEDHFEDVGIAG